MKTNLLYIFTALLACAVMLGISSAKAEIRVVIQNKCDKAVDKVACYNKTQGSDNEYRLAAWEDLKKLAIKRGYKLPKRVILIDPKRYRGYVEYETKLVGKVLYFAPMQPCRHIDRQEGLRALARR